MCICYLDAMEKPKDIPRAAITAPTIKVIVLDEKGNVVQEVEAIEETPNGRRNI